MGLFGDPLACQDFVELVTEYVEETLPRGERRRFEKHLAACGGCSNYLQQMRVTVRSLGALPPDPPDPDTRERLLAAFRELRNA
jgi:anti-sigma factor RsiW